MIGPFDLINQSAHSAVLYTARPDGSGMRRLSQRGIDGVYEDYHARFAASGKYLIFVRVRNRDIKSAVFRMRPDGSGVRQLTPWRLDADIPDLSLAAHGPAKDLVVFETFGHGPPKGSQQDIATVPATCHPLAACIREIRYVTHNGAGPAPASTRRGHRAESGSPSPTRSSPRESRRSATSGRSGPTAAAGSRSPTHHDSSSGLTGAADTLPR